MGALLTRDAILAAADLKFEEVAVPEWGGTVRVRSMTGADRDAFEQDIIAARDSAAGRMSNVRARLVSLAVVGETGQPIFSAADIAALGDKSIQALDRVYTVASRLNAVSDADVEALAKNSEAAPSGSSISA